MTKLIFYDIPSRDPRRCWSLNLWKTRMYLNFKKIDYETQWVEYPDIKPTFEGFGIPPNPPGLRPYTCPAIRLPDHTYIMDSKKIALTFEPLHPSPSLSITDTTLLPRVEALVKDAVDSLRPAWVANIPRAVLGPGSVEYFTRTREETFGMPLPELQAQKGEGAYEKARGSWLELAGLLKETEGPFFMGETVSYADFVLVSALHMFKLAGGEVFDRVTGLDPALLRVVDACAPWLERDSY